MSLSIDHDNWMAHAIGLANKSLPEDVPVGAIILDEHRNVIAEGWNQREKDQDPSGHAEIMALRLAGKHRKNWRLNGCTLYVTLEPCPMCASALLQSRISTVVFGAFDPIQGAFGSALDMASYYPTPIHRIGGIQEQACREQLHQFFKAHRSD